MNDENELRQVRAARGWQARLLMAWAVASVLVGIPLWFVLRDHTFLNAVGSQFVIWGAIDAVFAFGGVKQAARADRTAIDADAVRIELADREKLLRFLRFNAYLNWVWVGSGLVLLAAGLYLSNNAALLGHGVGVTVQGGFLFVVDWVFVRRLKTAS